PGATGSLHGREPRSHRRDGEREGRQHLARQIGKLWVDRPIKFTRAASRSCLTSSEGRRNLGGTNASRKGGHSWRCRRARIRAGGVLPHRSRTGADPPRSGHAVPLDARRASAGPSFGARRRRCAAVPSGASLKLPPFRSRVVARSIPFAPFALGAAAARRSPPAPRLRSLHSARASPLAPFRSHLLAARRAAPPPLPPAASLACLHPPAPSLTAPCRSPPPPPRSLPGPRRC